MAQDEESKEDKFDFTSEGEALEYISLAQARLLAMQTARESPGNYGRRFANVPMAFEITESGEDEDFYNVTLSLRPEGDFSGRPGQEQFFIGKEGEVAHRQVLRQPRYGISWALPLLVSAGVVAIIAVVVIGVVSTRSDDGEATVAAPITRASTRVPRRAPVVAVLPTDTPVHINTPLPTAAAAPLPTGTPLPTATTVPTNTPSLPLTPPPTYTPLPTYTPPPTAAPLPTYTSFPTATPRPTFTPLPTTPPMVIIITATPRPTATRVLRRLPIIVSPTRTPTLLPAPSGFISGINATVDNIKFFESPSTLLPRGQRAYRTSFDRSSARFIAWELNLSHPQPDRRISFVIDYVFTGQIVVSFLDQPRTHTCRLIGSTASTLMVLVGLIEETGPRADTGSNCPLGACWSLAAGSTSIRGCVSLAYSSFRRKPESIGRLNQGQEGQDWAPAYAGVMVKFPIYCQGKLIHFQVRVNVT